MYIYYLEHVFSWGSLCSPKPSTAFSSAKVAVCCYCQLSADQLLADELSNKSPICPRKVFSHNFLTGR